jgi:uncharacterized membrane protein
VGAIIGGIVGGIVAISIITYAIWRLKKKKK